MACRRWHARRIRGRSGDVWPVLESAQRKPEGWPGWPDGKQFAFVLSHDVESEVGVHNVKRLAELEMSLGFRSAFYFVPEGDYAVPADLRHWLTDHGFEVGVHDLYHDGKLYRSRGAFRAHATKINRYLMEWGAVGFRSGFMLRELDWLHDLNLAYDTSTFDTDPFEPQPEGVGTIFPFFVQSKAPSRLDVQGSPSDLRPGSRPLSSEDTRASDLVPPVRGSDLSAPGSALDVPRFDVGRGYIELPYTLPQDSTLFLLFGERDAGIWLRKADWIAKHGGMVLVNSHPDYMDLGAKNPRSSQYPVSHYAQLLESIRDAQAGDYWHALPREVARFAAALRPRLHRTPRRICMVAYSHFLSDARVKRYAEALAGRGDHVDVLALRRSSNQPARQVFGNLTLVNVQSREGKTEKGPLSFLLPILRFLFACVFRIAREHARNPYDVFHIHNIPDFLVFAAVYPRLRGAKVILDIHDIVPEFYSSKFHKPETALGIRLLKWAERLSARFAHHVIIANDLWLERYAARTGTEGKCSVFINNVDAGLFVPQPRTRSDGRRIILFPGGLQWHQGLDLAIQAFQKVQPRLPQAELHIYGDGGMKPELQKLTARLGLNDRVRFFDPLPVQEIAKIMANADLGIVPKRANSFGNEAYSTKIMEFMSVGVPVVASSTRIDRYYFNDSVLRFFESENVEAMADAIVEVLVNEPLRLRLVRNGLDYAARNSWEARKPVYLRLVDSLIERNSRDAGVRNRGEDPGGRLSGNDDPSSAPAPKPGGAQ
jgi:glycosyltransferase involved in cell wall biosynthesis